MAKSIQQFDTYIIDKNKHKSENLVGCRFERLTVLEFVGVVSPSRNLSYKCICECGKIIITTASNLRLGKTKSCGCLSKERIKTLNSLLPGEAAKRGVYRLLKCNAERRGIEFNLTFEESVFIASQDCYYCGKAPCLVGTKKYTVNGSWLHNSVDRLDSNKGYSFDNCVPACLTCNVAKSEMTVDQYIEHCKRVVNYWDNDNSEQAA